MKLRQPAADNSNPVHAVTFDCWGTLIYERDTDKGYAMRVDALQRVARQAGTVVDNLRARQALDLAWSRHWQVWCDGAGSGVGEIADWSLRDLGIEDPEQVVLLAGELACVALASDIIALPGASATLECLREAEVGLALICDTGFSPGFVVRQLLDRVGLLDMLGVQVFSDEAGVPKPHADVFHAALDELDVRPQHAVHVGDLRHTDVKGARAIGMGTIRINDHHDDQSALPDADAVAQSHAALRSILGIA